MMGNPRRVAVGLEQNRLAILLAVLHRHGGLQMADQDVFVNVVGGVKVTETSADLALMLSMVSSLRDRPCRRIWLSLARSDWPERFVRCPADRSALLKRLNMALSGRSCRRVTHRKSRLRACAYTARRSWRMRWLSLMISKRVRLSGGRMVTGQTTGYALPLVEHCLQEAPHVGV